MPRVFPRRNLKQIPIPVVSRQLVIVNPDGTVTRSGQLLLEQLQEFGAAGAGGDFETATFVIYDTTIGENVTNLLPVPRAGTAVIAGIVGKEDTVAEFTFDIFLTRFDEDFATRTSIFGTEKLTVPAGTPAGTLVTQETFLTEEYPIEEGDILSGDILASAGTGVYTVLLTWSV